MTTQTLSASAPERQLRRTFRGPVYAAGDDGYDERRKTWSGAVDSRPAVVAVAATPGDVRSALDVARSHGMPFAVQSTGHGTLVPTDGGVLLKTSDMAQVLVDPDRGVAHVGPGARWSQVISAAAPFGLAPLSGSAPSVGVAGYVLGGGVGWLSRKYGFAADSLVRADVVTADGRLTTVSADHEPELFWALRGAGGNFGVVTSMEIRLYPVATVYGGVAYYPASRAPELFAFFREWLPRQRDELSLSLVLTRSAPVDGVEGPFVAVRGVYAGPADDAERALRPLRDVAGPALADDFRVMPYAETGTVGGTAPRGFELLDEVPDALIELLCRPDAPANAVELRYWGGAMAEPGADAGPVGHRGVPFSLTVDGGHDAVAELAPYTTGGSFLNFLHDTTRTPAAYTPENYLRLQQLKRRHDPDNVFGRGHDIAPASAMGVTLVRRGGRR